MQSDAERKGRTGEVVKTQILICDHIPVVHCSLPLELHNKECRIVVLAYKFTSIEYKILELGVHRKVRTCVSASHISLRS